MQEETSPAELESSVPVRKAKKYVPPDEYDVGKIPGIPAETMAMIPPHGQVHEYVWWASQVTYANPIWHLASILPALAYDFAMLGFDFPGRRRQIALQSFLIGRSTAAKSTCLRLAKSFHEDFLLATRPRGWDLDSNTPWLQAEGTVPGLLEALSDKWDQEQELTPAILYNEEVENLLTTKDPQVIRTLMQLFDSMPKVERQLAKYRAQAKEGGAPPSCVRRPAVGGVFASTISAMQDTMKARHFEGGLVSRALWFVAEPDLTRYRDIVDFDRRAQREVVQWRWAQYGPHLYGLRARGDGWNVKPFSKEVKAIFDERISKRFLQAWADEEEAIAAQLMRAGMLAQTISCIYALSCGRLEVLPEDAEAAVNLVQFSIDSVSTLAGLTADEAHWRARNKVLEVVRRQPVAVGANRALLYKTLKVNKGELDQIMASMVDEGVLIECQIKSGGRGRPSLNYKFPEAAQLGKVIEFAPRDGDDILGAEAPEET